MAVAAAMAGVATLAGRNAVNGTRNRAQLVHAYWNAVDCVSRARAAIDSSLERSNSFDAAAQMWRALDAAVLPIALPNPLTCDIALEAAGTRLDVNAATAEMVSNLLRALGYDEATNERMTDALADWRDSDDVARPNGAERAWYQSAGRELPRNGDIADLRELPRVRGFEEVSMFDSVLTIDRARVSLATAPVAVLLAVPGFTIEAAQKVVELRESGTPLSSLIALLGMVSESSRSSLLSTYADIARLTTTDPDAWLLTVRGNAGFPQSQVVLRLRLQRVGKRAVATDSRSAI